MASRTLNVTIGGNHDAATLEDARACCARCSGAIDGPRGHYGRL